MCLLLLMDLLDVPRELFRVLHVLEQHDKHGLLVPNRSDLLDLVAALVSTDDGLYLLDHIVLA